MKSNQPEEDEEVTKLEQLHTILNNWIVSGKYVNYLLDFRQLNGPELVDLQVMFYLLREDVLHLLDDDKLFCILSFTDISGCLREFLLILFLESIESNLASDQCEWQKHGNFCEIINVLLRKSVNFLSDHTRDKIFDYLVKIIEKCDHAKTIERAWDILSHFPFGKNKPLLLELTDSDVITHSNIEQLELEKHWRLCEVIMKILEYDDSLSHQTHHQILDYLVKLIEILIDENDGNYESFVEFAINALKQIPFHKYQFLLHELVDSTKNLMETEKQYDREIYLKLGNILESQIEYYQDTLSQQTYDKLIEFIFTLHGRDSDISFAVKYINKFPPNRIQCSAVHYCKYLIEGFQASQHQWEANQNWCYTLEILTAHDENNLKFFFNDNFMKQLFDYFMMFFNHCGHMPTILSSILAIEKFCWKRLWGDEQINSLKGKLLPHLYYSGDDALPDNAIDYDRYQVNWCARWCVKNLMMKHCRNMEYPIIKLSRDRLGARYDFLYTTDDDDAAAFGKILKNLVRSKFPVTSGSYFYEVTIVTNGIMIFGWSRAIEGYEHNHYLCASICLSEKSISFLTTN